MMDFGNYNITDTQQTVIMMKEGGGLATFSDDDLTGERHLHNIFIILLSFSLLRASTWKVYNPGGFEHLS